MIVVLCPTRGRPDALVAALETFKRTKRGGETRFIAVVDADDASLPDYQAVAELIVVNSTKKGMVASLNHAVQDILDPEMGMNPDIIGFIGDDHRFRTRAWDTKIEKRLRRPGIAYASDGFQNENLPTQVFISREIVEALGYYALPDCHHLYVDNAWKAIGVGTNRLVYIPDILIEHMHPHIGKGKLDEGYERVNSGEMYRKDGAAYEAWRGSERYEQDVQRVRDRLGQ